MKDIVCGKDVDEATALMTQHGDRPFYFCSDNCEMAFVTDPLKYIEKTGVVASNEGALRKTATGGTEHSRS